MTLDSTTFVKVSSLLRLPHNTVEYHGSEGHTVYFFVGIKDHNGDYMCGIFVGVSPDFKIKKVKRVRISEGRFTRNYPVRRKTLPLYIAGL